MEELVLTIEKELLTTEVQQFADEAQKCIDLYSKKNHDYGNAFEDALNNSNLGLTYAAGLVYNKATRFVNLHNKTNCRVSESLEDTLLDLANYCVMTIVWLRKKNQKQ